MTVRTPKPAYADFDAPAKFLAIESIVARRLKEHPKAICSYSGGSDSDILIDLIERTRAMFGLPPVDYVFFNTGLEMQATKDHVKATAEKYGVKIRECRPEVGIVQAARTYGIPFMSKAFSERLYDMIQGKIPISVIDEYERAENKREKFLELDKRYPNRRRALSFLCSCSSSGEPLPSASQFCVKSSKYLADFISENPPDFKMSSMCCHYCKKQPAHKVQKNYDMVITGERQAEGGQRSSVRYPEGYTACFSQQSNEKYRLRPLYYVGNKDKAWYKEHYGIRYSDAYEVYGLTRTGCCGCPINYKAVEDLEKIRPFEPNVVKAAWNIFGKSYEYRRKYVEYKERRRAEEHADPAQVTFEDLEAKE